jgi:cellulose synthase/poly-beta-1,6-N-acetylglucosamine synthase-like glycosyltransferase
MQIALTVFIVLQVLIIIHLLFPAVLLLFKKISRNPLLRTDFINLGYEADYAVIVTAYEQITLIPSVVDSILKLNYTNYLIYVVADNCDISTLKFADERVIILRPENTLSNNIKSHFYAIDRFVRPHERLTIIDSDNLVDPEYLNELNKVFLHGYEAVQGVREAKNLNSNYACLDAAGDIYYRYIDRELLFKAGSSASLSGSGMAFTTRLYKDCLENLVNSGAGFDKILQYEILVRKLKIAFADQAIVYDEKTSKSEQLVKQRARWINTWFKFFILGLKLNLAGIITFNRNQFLFSIMLLRPPLFILFFLSFVCFAINIFVMPVASLVWFVSAITFMIMFYKSLQYFKADDRIYDSLKSVPKFMFFQVLALVKAKKANELSVATKHDQDANINDLK